METTFTFTRETYYELQKRRIFFYGLLSIIGLAGVIAFIILYVNLDYNKYLIFMFIPSLIFAASGLLYTVMILVMLFKLKDTEVKFTYQFNDEFVRIKTYSDGEKTSESELHYNMIYRYRDTGKVFFMYLASKKVFPLASDDPKLDDIKKLIKIEDIPKKKI